MPHVQIDQAASVADGLTMLVGLRGYTPHRRAGLGSARARAR
jgi:hypothetical protein